MTTLNDLPISAPLVIACFALSGCGVNASLGSESTANTSALSTTLVAAAQSTDVQVAWKTAAQKHNNSGIALRYKINGSPAIGKPLSIQLEFSGATAEDAAIQVKMDPALVSTPPVGFQKSSGGGYRMPLGKGQINTQSLTVTPQSDGMHFIQMQMTQAGRTSASSIAIRVGDTPIATPTLGEVQTTPQGEKIIVMPASK